MPPAEERAPCKMRLFDYPRTFIPMPGDGIEILFHLGASSYFVALSSAPLLGAAGSGSTDLPYQFPRMCEPLHITGNLPSRAHGAGSIPPSAACSRTCKRPPGIVTRAPPSCMIGAGKIEKRRRFTARGSLLGRPDHE